MGEVCSLWVKYIYLVFTMGEVYMWCSLWVKYIYLVFTMYG